MSSICETDYIIKQSQPTDTIIDNISKLGDYDILLVEGVNDKNIPKIRLGEIEKRDNTILTYNGDFGSLVKMIKNMIVLEEKNE